MNPADFYCKVIISYWRIKDYCENLLNLMNHLHYYFQSQGFDNIFFYDSGRGGREGFRNAEGRTGNVLEHIEQAPFSAHRLFAPGTFHRQTIQLEPQPEELFVESRSAFFSSINVCMKIMRENTRKHFAEKKNCKIARYFSVHDIQAKILIGLAYNFVLFLVEHYPILSLIIC